MWHRLREQVTHEEGLLDAAVVGDVLALRVGAVDARLDAVHAVAAVLIWIIGKFVTSPQNWRRRAVHSKENNIRKPFNFFRNAFTDHCSQ